MATSKIKRNGFGERQVITLPFTAQSDGVVHIYGATSQVSGGYSSLYIRCGSSPDFGFALSNVNALGGAFTGGFLVKMGEQVKQEYRSNISSYTCYFIPFK